MLDGATFHRLIHQHRLGIPRRASCQAGGDDVVRWPNGGRPISRPRRPTCPRQQYPELALSVPLGEHRLIAKFDLVAVEPGRRAVIVDWKTSRKQAANWLQARLQTRVYRYVLAQAGSSPERRRADRPGADPDGLLVRGGPGAPRDPAVRCDAARPRTGATWRAWRRRSHGPGDDDFPKTEDVRRCRFCPYRSLCNRGIEAGLLSEEDAEDDGEPEPEFDWDRGVDFEQIAEIAF